MNNHTKSKEGRFVEKEVAAVACNNFYSYKERKALVLLVRFQRTHRTSIMMLSFEQLPYVGFISCPFFAWANKSFATILTCNGRNALFIPF